LRAELFPNLLDNVRINQAKYEKLSFFEIGSIFADVLGTVNKNNNPGEYLPFEEKHLAILAAEDSAREAYAKVKGQFEYLLKSFGFSLWRFEMPGSQAQEWVEKGSFANVFVNNAELGFVALVDAGIASGLGVKMKVAILEISFTKLFNLFRVLPTKQYERSNKFPALERDLAFVVSDNILYGDIKNEIEKFDVLIKGAELFDV
jgi:phenylalanyl-tRNA synthetase beta subunit